MESYSIVLSVFIGLAVVLIVKLIQRMQKRWKYQHALRDFPMSPGEIFFLGHGKSFKDGADGMLGNWRIIYEDNEKAMQAWITPFTPTVICYHPDTVRMILNTSEPKDWSYDLLRDWLGDGLLLSAGRKWARNRRLLTPGFHFDILKPYAGAFVDSAKVLTMKWKDRCANGACSIEVMEDVSLATLESLMKCIMGVSDEEVREMGTKHPYIHANFSLTKDTYERFGHLLYLSDFIYAMSPDGARNRKALNIAHGFSSSVIAERRRRCHGNENGKDQSGSRVKLLPFIDILLQAKDADGTGLTDREIRDEVDTFMFEGHDTTSSALSFFIYNIATNPDAQERCREEIDSVMGKYGDEDKLEWDDLPKLEYLTQCIKESMRITAPVPGIGRQIQYDMKLPDGRVIPKGCSAYCHIYSLHRNPNIWPDPHTFDPDRFSPENCSQRPSHAFVPFAAGPRNCIGQHFAMAELRATSAVLLRHFRFAADTERPVQRIATAVLRSTTGIHVKVSLRDS